MITRDPDITRLLDRMEKRGLISRARENREPSSFVLGLPGSIRNPVGNEGHQL